MPNIPQKSRVALASTGSRLEDFKLKHWTQAIRDLYVELETLRNGVVPKWHASPFTEFGPGDTYRYGHLKLLDSLLLRFHQNADESWWTRSNVAFKANYRWNAVEYHAGLFVAVGSHGRIMTSVDGKTWDDAHWVTVPASATYEFYDVKWCGNMFVAVGSYNSLTYSYDGAYWHVPMHIGTCFSGNTLILPDDNPTSSGNFRSGDAWKGVTYDEENGIIMLCGTQNRTLACRYSATDSVAALIPGQTVYHIPKASTGSMTAAQAISALTNRELRSIASMPVEKNVYDESVGRNVPKRLVTFAACGNFNQVVQCYVDPELPIISWMNNGKGTAGASDTVIIPPGADPENTQNAGQAISIIVADVLTVEDNVHVLNPKPAINKDTGWNSATVQKDSSGRKMIVLLGTDAHSVASLTGEDYSWNVPLYYSPDIKTEFTCQATAGNLAVAAGKWISSDDPNVTMFNSAAAAKAEALSFGDTGDEPVVQHISVVAEDSATKNVVEAISWAGAAYGKHVFVLAGDNNALYWHECIEEDYSGAALSVDFYKQYIQTLEDRIKELEGLILRDDMSYIYLHNSTRTFNWNSRNAYMFKTLGDVTLNFNPAPQSIYKEIAIYLEAEGKTKLSLAGAGEWENDLAEPEWGNLGSHLALRAIFIGSRVIVQIIDNDQLADNLALLDENQPQP